MDTIMKGSHVEITGTAHPGHAHIIGQRGVVHRFVKSRGIYQIDLAKGSRWESYPQNVRHINGGSV